MVHDPRVTTLLSRLGGLYRDPSRVDRDASSLLKSSVGAHLTPGIAPLVENNGDSSNCLVLQGTIAIVFRGTTYQLLVDIYLPPGYPIRPPISYIRLAPNMYLKENHPHVGSDGMVYMPYTHEWNARTHSLIEMIVAMSSIFSADPPVFTRQTPAPAPPPPPPAYHPPSTGDGDYIPPAGSGVGVVTESERYMQEQIAIIAAREAEEAERDVARALEEVRKAEEAEKRAEEERIEQIAAQVQWEEKKTIETRHRLDQKIHAHLTTVANQTKTGVQADWRDEQQLNKTKEKIAKEIDELEEKKAQLTKAIVGVEEKTLEINEWLKENENNQEGGKRSQEVNIDDICQPVSKLHSQMLDLSAENSALTDAMYFVDKSMYMGQMDCNTHLKTVRKLAKRQFLIRAHLIKINQVMLKNNH